MEKRTGTPANEACSAAAADAAQPGIELLRHLGGFLKILRHPDELLPRLIQQIVQLGEFGVTLASPTLLLSELPCSRCPPRPPFPTPQVTRASGTKAVAVMSLLSSPPWMHVRLPAAAGNAESIIGPLTAIVPSHTNWTFEIANNVARIQVEMHTATSHACVQPEGNLGETWGKPGGKLIERCH